MLNEVINYYLRPTETPALTDSPTDPVTPITPATPENRVAHKKTKYSLAEADQAKLLSYLDAIGETDQDMMAEFLDECSADAETLHYALQLAEDTLRVRHGDTVGLVRCMSCHRLIADTCSLYHWRIVVDKWRRCADFDLKNGET